MANPGSGPAHGCHDVADVFSGASFRQPRHQSAADRRQTSGDSRDHRSRGDPLLSPARAHAAVPIFASWPGAGPVHASRLSSALGTDRRRYAHVEDFLTFAGMAPLLERSGKTTVTHFRWLCPKFLRPSFHACAGQSIPYSRWAKAFSRQQRMRGKDHQAAVRSLALKWTRMIFPMWKNQTPYHEQTSVAALQRRGSPLFHVMAEHPA